MQRSFTFGRTRRTYENYYSPTLLQTLVGAMQSSLPTTVAAGIAFNRLVADGTIKRTDGRTEHDDNVAAVAAAQADLEHVVAEVDAKPLSKSELEYFASLNRRELSSSTTARTATPLNEFAIRYNRACREFHYVVPPRFSDQVRR